MKPTLLQKQAATAQGIVVANAISKEELTRSKYKIEIVDMNPIEGGVEVFVRAWLDGTQIGFGVDGTVDIERFRIYNPQTRVLDPNGDIITEQKADEENGIPYSRTVQREDPKEALIQAIEATLDSKKEISFEGKIEPGKIGKTTSTFYSATGSNSPVDGQINCSGADNTWQTFRDAAGTGAFDSLTTAPFFYLRASTGSNVNLMVRSYFLFDTSSIPDADVISSATFSTYIVTINNPTAHGTLDAVVSTVTTGSNSALATGDYAIANFTGAVTATVPATSYTASAFYNHAITNLSAINKTGITKFGSLTNEELTNTAPSTITSSTVSSINVYTADQTGANIPYLTVEHAAAGGNTTNFFYMT